MRLVIGWKRPDGALSFMTPCGPESGDDNEGQDISNARYCRRIAEQSKTQWAAAEDDSVPKELKDAVLLGWCLSDKSARDLTEKDFQDFEEKDEPKVRSVDINIRSDGRVVNKLKDKDK